MRILELLLLDSAELSNEISEVLEESDGAIVAYKKNNKELHCESLTAIEALIERDRDRQTDRQTEIRTQKNMNSH